MKHKPHNNGTWTEARFHSFICSALRQAWSRWGPKATVLREARIERGFYRCAACGAKVPASLPGFYKTGPKQGKKKRVKNVSIDHIDPVVSPETGFVSWDSYIERMFVEKDKLQALCKACHDLKSSEERARRKKK